MSNSPSGYTSQPMSVSGACSCSCLLEPEDTPGVARVDPLREIVVDAEEVHRVRLEQLACPRRGPAAPRRASCKVSMMSAGYAPFSTGSRNQRLVLPVRDAGPPRYPTSPSVQGYMVCTSRAMPMRLSRGATSRTPDREGMRVEQDVRRLHRRLEIAQAGSVDALRVAEKRGDLRLVERHPGLHPVPEVAEHAGSVFGEPGGGVAVGPPARVLQRLRKVPVIQRERGLDPGSSRASTRPS